MREAPTTVRAVCGAAVRDDVGRILLVQRADDSTWGLPGGGVEPGETWQLAAERECREETGWRIAVRGLLGVYSDPDTQLHRYPDGRVVHFYGVVLLADPLERIGEPDGEVTRVGWFSLDALPRPLFAPDVPVLCDLSASRERPSVR